MSQSDARDSKFGPSFNTQIDRRGSGPAAKSPVEVNLFYATPAYLTFGAEASGRSNYAAGPFFLERHLLLEVTVTDLNWN
jgi:hypothetical protein